jgi:hypothetical protein
MRRILQVSSISERSQDLEDEENPSGFFDLRQVIRMLRAFRPEAAEERSSSTWRRRRILQDSST